MKFRNLVFLPVLLSLGCGGDRGCFKVAIQTENPVIYSVTCFDSAGFVSSGLSPSDFCVARKQDSQPQIKKGSQVNYFGTRTFPKLNGDWYQISSGDTHGYIRALDGIIQC